MRTLQKWSAIFCTRKVGAGCVFAGADKFSEAENVSTLNHCTLQVEFRELLARGFGHRPSRDTVHTIRKWMFFKVPHNRMVRAFKL